MKLNAQELSELARELLTHQTYTLQQGLESIGLDDVDATALDKGTMEDLADAAVQCACGFWKRPSDMDSAGVCKAGCPTKP